MPKLKIYKMLFSVQEKPNIQAKQIFITLLLAISLSIKYKLQWFSNNQSLRQRHNETAIVI